VTGQIGRGFTWWEAESFVATLVPNSEEQVPFNTPSVPQYRNVDVYGRNSGWMNEVKTGSISNSAAQQTQIRKDNSLMTQGSGFVRSGNLKGRKLPIKGDTWWFLPNSVGITNPSHPLIRNLEANGINIVILYFNNEGVQSLDSSAVGIAADSASCKGITAALQVINSQTVANADADSSTATEQGFQSGADVVLNGLSFGTASEVAGSVGAGSTSAPTSADAAGDGATAASEGGEAADLAELLDAA
jgi:hypothetical protein